MDKWVTTWLSEARLLRYLNAASGDETLAIALYVWNSKISAALLRDVSDVEVLIRNKFNDAVTSRRKGVSHWLLDPNSPVRVERLHYRSGGQVDSNQGLRDKIEKAIKDAGGVNATPGHVVAQLMFGFWLSLVSKSREHELWTPYLAHAFKKPRPTRSDVEKRMRPLNDLRNRVAHHEHLLGTDIGQHHAWLLEIASWLSPEVADHISAHSTVLKTLVEKPC